jgi:hypothetical protein
MCTLCAFILQATFLFILSFFGVQLTQGKFIFEIPPLFPSNINVRKSGGLLIASGAHYDSKDTFSQVKSKNSLYGPPTDVSKMKEFLVSKNVNVTKIILRRGRDPKRDDVLKQIREFFELNIDDYLLYYTGHGEEKNGSWIFGEKKISFDDIMLQWKHNLEHESKRLFIISDSCYSGHWPLQAKHYEENIKSKNRIFIQAATRVSEYAKDTYNGSYFTQEFVRTPDFTKSFPVYPESTDPIHIIPILFRYYGLAIPMLNDIIYTYKGPGFLNLCVPFTFYPSSYPNNGTKDGPHFIDIGNGLFFWNGWKEMRRIRALYGDPMININETCKIHKDIIHLNNK